MGRRRKARRKRSSKTARKQVTKELGLSDVAQALIAAKTEVGELWQGSQDVKRHSLADSNGGSNELGQHKNEERSLPRTPSARSLPSQSQEFTKPLLELGFTPSQANAAVQRCSSVVAAVA